MSDGVLRELAQIFDFAGVYGIVRIAIVFLILVGYWSGLKRSRITTGQRAAAWLFVAVPLIPFAIFAPVLVGLILLMRSARVSEAIDVVPADWLIGLQAYRLFGAAFLVQ